MTGVAEVDGGVEGPVGVHQMGPGHDTQVGPSRHQDVVDVVDGGDPTHGHGGDAHLVADPIRIGSLVETAVLGVGPAGGLAGGDVDQITAQGLQLPGEGHGVVAGEPSGHPVGGGDPHRDRLRLRPDLPHRGEDLERITHPVLKRPPVDVAALVR